MSSRKKRKLDSDCRLEGRNDTLPSREEIDGGIYHELDYASNEERMMITVANGNTNHLNFLLKENVNVHYTISGETVSDIAWKNKHFEVLIILIRNDAPFPKFFDEKQIEAESMAIRFKWLIRARTNFHNAIRNNLIDKIKLFLKNRNFKFLYDKNNHCALETAFSSRNFDVYSFLRSKGFSEGINFKLNSKLPHLADDDKESLRKCNLKYFLTNENQYIINLVSKSRLVFKNSQKKFPKIQKWFETLESLPELRPILRIVSDSDETDIIFDFNKSSIEEMDPSGSANIHGRTYSSGNIFIAANRSDDAEVLGTLAHELTHYALLLLYKNDSLPFDRDDDSRKNEFTAIVETYDTGSYKSRNNIIERALQESYSAERKMAELIVRVPHILAIFRNKPDVVKKIREDFSLLFDFFKRLTLLDLEKEANLVETKRNIKDANLRFGVFAKADQSCWLSATFFRSIDLNQSVFIYSSVPNLVLEGLVKLLRYGNSDDITSSNIFVNLEQTIVQENFEMIESSAESQNLQKIFIIEDSEKYGGEFIRAAWNDLYKRCKIIFISVNKNSAFRDSIQSTLEFNFHWRDLSEKSQSRIRELKITFQGFQVFLKEIVKSEIDTLLQEIPFEQVLEPTKIKLQSFDETLPSLPRVLIERKFHIIDDEASKEALKSKDICEILQSQKLIIVSDAAGMGKSTSAAQIARELKSRNSYSWVVFIDLKQHTDAFVKDCQSQTSNIDANYFSEKIIKLSSTFEQKLFEELFKNEKVIFVVDGFDEISPNYKHFVLYVLEVIKKSSNWLLLTTRPHLVEELRKKFGSVSKVVLLALIPFSKKDQVKFLTKYLQKENSKNENQIASFLKHNSNFYSTPMHLFMLAEFFDKLDLAAFHEQEINIYMLYKGFITKKYEIWHEKGPLAKVENAEIQQSNSNLQQIFIRLGLEELFDASDCRFPTVPEIFDDFSDEMIARVGLLNLGHDGSKYFLHQTFAEYFAADFILKGIFSKNPNESFVNLVFEFLIGENFEMARKFANEGLIYFKDKQVSKAFTVIFAKLGDKLLEVTLNKKKRSILYHLVIENHANLIALILETLIGDLVVKVKLVKSVLFKAVQNMEISKIIWKCVESFEKPVQKQILFGKKGDENILRLIICADNRNDENGNMILKLFLEVAMNLLNGDEFLKLILGEEKDHFQFYADVGCYKGILGVIWNSVKKTFKNERLKELALGSNGNGNTILRSFFTDLYDDLLLWLEDVKKNLLTSSELNELLAQCDSVLHRNIVSIKFYNFEKLWLFIEQNVDKVVLKKIIFINYSDEGESIPSENENLEILVERSITNKDKQLVNFIFSKTESLLEEDGDNIISYFERKGRLVNFIFNVAIWSPWIYEKISMKIDENQLNVIFRCRTSNGDNILHHLVHHSNLNDSDKSRVWNLIVDKINDVYEMRSLLLEEDATYKHNVFHLAACFNDDLLIEILYWFKKSFEDDLKNIFVIQKPGREFTLLHEWFRVWRKDSVEKGLAFIEQNFSTEDQNLILSLRDCFGRTPKMLKPEKKESSSFSYYIRSDSSSDDDIGLNS